MIRHHFTVDVVEHFQVLALAPWVPRARGKTLESRVARNVVRLLDLSARHAATATCLTLGWVAERQPAVVRAMAAAGHEVAWHCYDYRRVTELQPEEFRRQVRRTIASLAQLDCRVTAGHGVAVGTVVAIAACRCLLLAPTDADAAVQHPLRHVNLASSVGAWAGA